MVVKMSGLDRPPYRVLFWSGSATIGRWDLLQKNYDTREAAQKVAETIECAGKPTMVKSAVEIRLHGMPEGPPK